MKPSAKRVPRETLEVLAAQYDLEPGVAAKFERLLAALAAEPDPHTTVWDPIAAADVHIADSLAGIVVPELRAASTVVDIGAGPGFPGLVLAAALPEARVDLIESTRRKVDVLERLAAAAGIDARPVAARAEDWARGEGAGAYAAVTARAVAPLAVLVEYAAPLLAPGGVLVAWKGARDDQEETGGEAAAAIVGLKSDRIVPVTPYPGSRNRHLHVYLKVAPTPDRFPRRSGMAIKRPLSDGSARDSTSS